MPTGPPSRIFLVDDHPVFRFGIRQLIETHSDLTVIGEAADAASALAALREGPLPDLTLIDLSLPGSSGVDLVKRLASLYPGLRMLIISMHDEHLYAERALRAGAVGYITKATKPEATIQAIRKALRGEITLSDGAATTMLRSALGAPRTSTRYGNLSDRELEVFELIGRGIKPAAIATALSISTKTVERHQAAIKEKLGVSQMSELRRIAAIWSNENREAGID